VASGVVTFLAAYIVFAATPPAIAILAVAFVRRRFKSCRPDRKAIGPLTWFYTRSAAFPSVEC
jgi:hypothetical protein